MVMWRGICMVVLFICLFSACALPAKRDAYGRAVPRWPNWTLKTDNPDPEGLICYDCIYVEDFGNYGVYPGYVIRRYWASGHVWGKGVEDYDDLETINSKFGGGIGYYRVEGPQILIEQYSGGEGGHYIYSEGFIEADGSIVIVSMGSFSDQLIFPRPKKHIPIKAGKVDWEPDW
ncbi:hypothetical protein LZ24_03231 [Desulfobotulus alkaliphilus]|uniref:Uncharacterized protein n=1 Tax=Desulfobotulus alkaliphilus TaxID=622671 RepID=A0A562R508_9BACT|nr:hypothetical protein [Desulfobotulus alkaliphilus]TWI63913.1 hypothetical protein LZ24_03231 [Desulfobotulus alkaliphilus]